MFLSVLDTYLYARYHVNKRRRPHISDDNTFTPETMHLTQIPGMPESILAAAEDPLEDGVAFKDLEW